MTKEYIIKRINSLRLDDIRYYMAEPSARYERCDSWSNRFIIAVAQNAIPFEEMYNFVQVVAYYNKNIF